jgi:adenosylcobinamide kinase/adenosylcobinamide-phosphate guanylyltransferase
MGDSITLVTGPARSGKSRWAEHLAQASGLDVTYVATGASGADDPLWQARLALHRQRRPLAWGCLEVGFELANSLGTFGSHSLALVDSLGSWVAHGLELDSVAWDRQCQRLLMAMDRCKGSVIVVSEQAGWGVVPPTAIGGLFRDRLGGLEQQVMAIATTGWLVVAGRALDLLTTSVAVPESNAVPKSKAIS